jgi:HD-like signal output (HDOD) protein
VAAPTSASVDKPVPPSIVRHANPQVAAMLRDFKLVHSTELPPQEARATAELLGRIPRPPSALHKLVSPDYLANTSSAELGDMVMAEPQVAAKVLAVVNSPLYGLKTPLGSLSQAITFMGINSVRGICLQYLMDSSFRSDDAEVQRIFKSLWNASTLASELCFKLAQMLELPEQGSLVTRVVLSYLGQVASHSLLPKTLVLSMRTRGLLERSRTEQEHLGLCAAELGCLLMQQWALPPSIIAHVRAVDQVLLAPPDSMATAVCYLSARLGEKLARGDLTDLASFDLAQEAGPEFFHLQSYLQAPGMARLTDCLHKPSLVAGIHNMMHNMQRV